MYKNITILDNDMKNKNNNKKSIHGRDYRL